MTYQDMIAAAEEKVAKKYEALEELKQAIYPLEQELNEAKDELSRLKNIAVMATYSDETLWKWNTVNQAGNSEQVWKEYSWFRIYGLTFNVIILERRDLKKWKYQVRISASSQVNGYCLRDTLKRKYPDQDLERKFTTEGEARQWMQDWMARLETDYADEIKAQLEIARLSREAAGRAEKGEFA